jgi:hypothetical protein
MSDTLNSWKQLLRAKQDIGRLDGVTVLPQGLVELNLNEAIEVAGCNVTVKDSDKVTINKEVCCPPIEFGIIMGEQDINRPGITNEDQGRIIWTTNANTAPRFTWGPAGQPTANLVNGNGVEAKVHEMFILGGLVIGAEFEFIVGGTRAFCSDAASSDIYSFLLGVITEVAITSTLGIAVLTEILNIGAETTCFILEPTHWLQSSSSGGQAGVPHPIGLAGPTPPVLTISAATTFTLADLGAMRAVAAITTVP